MKTIRSNGRRPVDFTSFDGLKSTEPDGQRGVFIRQKSGQYRMKMARF
jgi:hypothetical protein